MALIDDLTGVDVKGAFSIQRYLRTAYTGAVVQLREDNGNTTQDFKLNGSNVLVTDDVSEDTVATWLSANSASNAYASALYDQSTAGNDFTQATTTEQPLFVDGSAPYLYVEDFATQMVTASITRSASLGFWAYLPLHVQTTSSSVRHYFGGFATTIHTVAVEAAPTTGAGATLIHQLDSGQNITSTQTIESGTTYIVGHNMEATGANPRNGDVTINTVAYSGSGNADVRSGAHYLFSIAAGNALTTMRFTELLWGEDELTSAEKSILDTSLATQAGVDLPPTAAEIAAATDERLLTRRIPWTRKPDYPVPINQGSSLAKGLVACVQNNSSGFIDLKGQSVTNTGTTELIYGNRGRVRSYNGSSDYSTMPVDLSHTDKATISFWLYYDNTTDTQLDFEFTANGNVNNGFYIGHAISGQFRATVGKTGGVISGSKLDTRPAASGWNHYSITMDRSVGAGVSAVRKVYVNGVSVSITNVVTNDISGSNFADDTLYFMSRAGSSLHSSGDIDDVRIWDRLLTDAELRENYFNSYQLLQPRTQYIPYSTAAAGGGGDSTVYPSPLQLLQYQFSPYQVSNLKGGLQ